MGIQCDVSTSLMLESTSAILSGIIWLFEVCFPGLNPDQNPEFSKIESLTLLNLKHKLIDASVEVVGQMYG